MSTKTVQQRDFSSVLLDGLFGLILFFSLDSFLEIETASHLIFYLFSIIIVVHWWLLSKADHDICDEEVNNSVVYLVFGIICVVLIEYIILMSKVFNYKATVMFLIAALIVDLLWTLIWRYVGKWDTKDDNKIVEMERELNYNINIDLLAIILFSILLFISAGLTSVYFISIFILIYLIYIFLTIKYKIIDLQIF